MSINSIDRALDIINLLYNEGHELGISEISQKLDVYKSTVHRTLLTLENRNFIEQNPKTEKYWLGIRFYTIGLLLQNSYSLSNVIKPFARDLFEKFHEVVNVSVLDLSDACKPQSVIIHKEQSEDQILTVNPSVGSHSDCHCSAVGKCLLAFQAVDLTPYRATLLRKYTRFTITDWAEFAALLRQVRDQGYALDNEELEIGLTCIGAPILDRTGRAVAAISLSGPTQRMRDLYFNEKIASVKEIARQIAQAL